VTEFAFASPPAQKLLGRTPKRKMSFPFQKKNHPRENIKKQETSFLFGVAE
jgi:hypothetical protein